MKVFFEIIVTLIGAFNLLMTRFALFPIHQPTTMSMWLIKVFVSALSPILLLMGVLIASLGWLLDFTPAMVFGGLSSFFYLVHIITVTRPPDRATGFEKAFGRQFEDEIPRSRSAFFLRSRYVILLPKSPDPIWTRDIPFYTIPESGRQLLCDLWQPSEKITRSGLAFIYLHGSAWSLLDKDYGTRIFFRRLTSQGHVVMDVAYRLFPEGNFVDMVHDAKHAIAWMKMNSVKYGVNKDRVVIGGGSAGAHIALLAAYTSKNTDLTPADLINGRNEVRGVVSLYGESDLSMTFYHTAQHLVSHSGLSQKKNTSNGGQLSWMQKKMGSDFHRLGFDKDVEPGMLIPMLGGTPNQKPEAYTRFSPISYVNQESPATLLIHGQHDILAPPVATKALRKKLDANGVCVVMHVLPQTDHAFDLILPRISPSSHSALYDVERFLALLV